MRNQNRCKILDISLEEKWKIETTTHVDTKEYYAFRNHGNLCYQRTIKIKYVCVCVCVKAIFFLHKPPSQHILSICVKALCVAVEIHVSYRVENSTEKTGRSLMKLKPWKTKLRIYLVPEFLEGGRIQS